MTASNALLLLMTICIAANSNNDCDLETATLCVNMVNTQGFGDLTNQYAFSSAIFNGDLYVGTLNAVNGPTGIPAFFLGDPFLTNGAQIWKGTINDNDEWLWQQVLTNGNGNALNYGVRKMITVNDYLYGTTGNHGTEEDPLSGGFEVWRTNDGENWEIVLEGGMNEPNNTSGRGMGTHDGYLYVGAENRATFAKMFRRQLAENGDFADDSEWEEVISDGLEDGNIWFSDFAEYNDYLYTGTLNSAGMQLWRTSDGVTYENIFREGNGLPGNFAAMKLYVYNDRLYIGTMNLFVGASLWVNDDDDGLNFVPVFLNGNGNPNNAYVWYLEQFQDRLYAGTFDATGVFTEGAFSGFDLFSAEIDNPPMAVWSLETTNAFGGETDRYSGHYGTRTMAVIDDKLMIGTASLSLELGCIMFQTTPNFNIKRGNSTLVRNHEELILQEENYQERGEMVCGSSWREFDIVDEFCARIGF